MKKIIYLSLLVALISFSSCNKEKKDSGTLAQKENLNFESGEVIHLNKQDFFDKVANFEKSPNEWIYLGDKPCIIDFYADWCKPCKIASPILEELAREYAGKIVVYKVDTQVERELAAGFGIQAIPAFLWVPMNGQPQMSNGIAKSEEETKKMFTEMIENILLKN